jgi:hypothetical protein
MQRVEKFRSTVALTREGRAYTDTLVFRSRIFTKSPNRYDSWREVPKLCVSIFLATEFCLEMTIFGADPSVQS